MHSRGTEVIAVHDDPVVVPLDVGDVVLAEDGVHLVAHMRVCLWVAEVENLLVAPLRWGAALDVEDPLGVGAEDVGVGVDHFGLEPQAELHAAGVDVLDERTQPVRPHGRVDPPVAQAREVVTAGVEPAVVKDEALHPHLGGDVGELTEAIESMVEVDGLPHVQGEGAGPDVGGVVRAGP